MNISGGQIVWILDADTGKFTRAMIDAETKAKSTATNVDKSLSGASASFEKTAADIGKGFSSVGEAMTKYVTLPTSIGFGLALKSAGSFESSLSQLKQASSATGDEMARFASLARDVGRDSNLAGVTAADAARVMVNLSKAGLDVNDTYSATRGVMQMAKAGNIDFADAAVIAASALNAFNLKGTEMGKVADAIAAGANASQAEMQDLALGMQQSATVAKQFGLSLNDNVTALSLFANNGIRGSDAGTSLKTMLIRLASPSKEAAGAMAEIGFNAYDAQGKFVGLKEMALRLQKGLSGLTDEQKQNALATIFGTDAFRAAAIMADNAGASWDSMATAVGKQGAASELAAAQMGPYEKNMERLKNSISELGLQIGEKLIPSAIRLMDSLKGVIDWFGSLDPKVQDGIIKFALFAAAFGPVTKGIGTVISGGNKLVTVLSNIGPGLTTFKLGLQGISGAAQGNVFAGIMGGLGRFVGFVSGTLIPLVASAIPAAFSALSTAIMAIPVIGWIIAAITAVVGVFIWLWNTNEDFRNGVIGIWNGILDFFKGIGDWFSGTFGKFFEDTWNNIQIGLKAVGDFFSSIWNGIVTFVTEAVTNIVNFFQPLIQIFQFIGYAIGAFGQIVWTIFSTIGQIIWTVVSTIVQIIGVILYGSFTWFWNNVLVPLGKFFADTWNNIVSAVSQAASAVWGVISSIFTTVWNFIVGILTNIWNGFVNFFSPIVNFVAGIFNQVWGTISRVFNQIWGTISKVVGDVWNTVSSIFNKIAGVIGDALQNAYNTVAGWVGSFTSAGKNIIDGIVNGIKNGAGAVIDKVKEICSGALDAVKSFFGIKSPSRVMATMGDYLMKGFSKGIDRSAQLAIDSAQGASEGILGAFSQADNNYTFGVDNLPRNTLAPITPNDYQQANSSGGVVINQTNNVNTELDMNQVNRNLTWELNKI